MTERRTCSADGPQCCFTHFLACAMGIALYIVVAIVWEAYNDEAPTFIESNDITVNSNTFFWDSSLAIQLLETCAYEFDANSDPLMLGRMFVHYMKTGQDFASTITLYIPLEDKPEYDAIMAGEDE